MIPREETVTRARPLDVETVRAELLDSVSWWSARARLEAAPNDRLWVCFGCGACGAVFGRTFEVGDPRLIYRHTEDLDGVHAALLAGHSPHIEPSEWRAATECACGAPPHHRRAVGVALLHSVLGSGAGAVLAEIDGSKTWLRCPDGSGALEPVEPSSAGFRSAFGRPLTLFDAWLDVTGRLPLAPGTAAGTLAERGVWMIAAPSSAALEHAVRATLGARRRVLVAIDADTAASWPRSLSSLRLAVEEGSHVALVVELAALMAQARTWSRSVLHADVRVSGPQWTLVTGQGEWPLAPASVALSMAARGLTLGEATARALDDARSAVRDRVATLEALTAMVPGSSFEVVGTTATARRADGRPARTLDLAEIPVGAGALPDELLAREAAFVFDLAPPWADRGRVCPCGAPLDVETRLVPWPWRGEAAPRVVQVLAAEGMPGAAEVVALACDRHVRIPSERELEELGLADAVPLPSASTRRRVRVAVSTGTDGPRALVARAPFISHVVLSDGLARALSDAAGRPFSEPRAVGWAIGSHAAVLLPDGTPDADLARLLSERGLGDGPPFVLRRALDLSGAPVGAFDVIVEHG